ncbi:MAG: hypothetical protein ACPGSO_00765 [Vicingaceae bacterium]
MSYTEEQRKIMDAYMNGKKVVFKNGEKTSEIQDIIQLAHGIKEGWEIFVNEVEEIENESFINIYRDHSKITFSTKEEAIIKYKINPKYYIKTIHLVTYNSGGYLITVFDLRDE